MENDISDTIIWCSEFDEHRKGINGDNPIHTEIGVISSREIWTQKLPFTANDSEK